MTYESYVRDIARLVDEIKAKAAPLRQLVGRLAPGPHPEMGAFDESLSSLSRLVWEVRVGSKMIVYGASVPHPGEGELAAAVAAMAATGSVEIRLGPIDGDNHPRIQAAIDAIGDHVPPDASGHRGTVVLEAGNYRIQRAISLREGVVLRGTTGRTVLTSYAAEETSVPHPGEGELAVAAAGSVEIRLGPVDAMPGGGTFRIATRNLRPGEPGAPGVLLEVVDTGAGNYRMQRVITLRDGDVLRGMPGWSIAWCTTSGAALEEASVPHPGGEDLDAAVDAEVRAENLYAVYRAEAQRTLSEDAFNLLVPAWEGMDESERNRFRAMARYIAASDRK